MKNKFTKESFWNWVSSKFSSKDAAAFYKKITGEDPPKK